MPLPSTLQASIIIPAHNAAEHLDACLRSVFASRDVGFEVIVVDDASSDATVEIARRYPCRLIALDRGIFAANARNLGARHARGEILVFIDSDELVGQQTVATFVAALRDQPGVDAIVGSLTADTPAAGFLSRFKNFQHHFTHQNAAREGSTLDSGRMAIRRRVFEQLGGFEPAFSGASIEDIALGYRMRRLGHRIRFDPSIQIVHLKTYTLAQLLRSDIMHRAIPWTILMLRERVFRNDLNTRSSNVASVAAAALGAGSLLAGAAGFAAGWAIAAVAAVAIPLLNARFLIAVAGALGIGFAVRSALFLPFMYLYQGVGLGLGLVAAALGRSAAAGRTAPTPSFRIYEPTDEGPAAGAGGGARRCS